MRPYMFDFRRFLVDAFNNPRGLLSFLQAYGIDHLGLTTIDKWFQRGSIPSTWFALVLAYVELDQGQPQSISKYLKPETSTCVNP